MSPGSLPVARRLAVTGASGFVGRHLVRHAVGLGFEVVGVVRSEAAARTVLQDGGRPAIVPGLTANSLTPALRASGAVVHLAQIGGERDGANYETVNVEGTRTLVVAARAAGVPRLVHFSGLGVARYGIARRSTNRYFLSKLAAELEVFRSGLETVVFRPSYIVGPGHALLVGTLQELAAGEIELPGDGSYRMQPIGVRDVAAATLKAAEGWAAPCPDVRAPRVFELVGPELVSYRQLLERLASVARSAGRKPQVGFRSVAMEEVDRQAAAGGYRGMLPDEVDCLFCDELGDPRPLEALLGRFLTPLDEVLAGVVRGWGGPAG